TTVIMGRVCHRRSGPGPPAYDPGVLADGRYDAIVFDADGSGDGVHVELTILAGDHKGEVVSVRTGSWTGDPIDLLGIPPTIVVSDGEPAVTFEPLSADGGPDPGSDAVGVVVVVILRAGPEEPPQAVALRAGHDVHVEVG